MQQQKPFAWFTGSIVALVLLLTAAAGAQSAAPATTQGSLAQTPPMGWNSWNAFHLEITDKIILAQAQAMVKTGMKAAGYEYVVIDGGWEGRHDAQGIFHSDPDRFPDMKKLCDDIHALGLKVGIHTSPGPLTCSHREASYGHETQDAQTFANWGIDFVKYDWCSADQVYKPDQMQAAYKKFADAIQATGRPMVYSLCQYGMQNVWTWGASVGGQMWRTTGDLQDNYFQMIAVGFAQNGLERFAGPGHWNDPDMLEIGNKGMDAGRIAHADDALVHPCRAAVCRERSDKNDAETARDAHESRRSSPSIKTPPASRAIASGRKARCKSGPSRSPIIPLRWPSSASAAIRWMSPSN